MSRQKGTANLAASLEVLAGAPLDARSLVDTASDLTVTSNFPYPYVGMTVTVKATGKKYTLMALPVSTASNWQEDGGGSSITIDDELSTTSENAVQNKVITNAFSTKADLVDGKIPAAQLPSYVDDVVEGYLYNGAFYSDSQHTQQITPEDSKIYLDIPNNKTYRWDGSQYVEVGGGGVALGETSSTAYRGDRGKTAYDISQTVGNVSSLQTTAKSTVVAAINEVRNFDNLTNRPKKGITATSSIIDPLPGTKPRVMKYSTDEQVVGEWIDGKPLYQKTVVINSITSDAITNVPHNISNLGVVTDIGGSIVLTSGACLTMPYNVMYNTSWCNIMIDAVTSTNISLLFKANVTVNVSKAYVTLQYTKLTD